MIRPIRMFMIAAFVASWTSPGQTLSGTVVADDTGAPIGGATVLAIQRMASYAQPPAIYKAVADPAGRYGMTVSAGQYQLCVHDAGVYLNPCQWGPATPAVTVATSAVANLRLQKGAWFIVRIHDTPQLLSQVETIRGTGVTVHLSAANLREFPLPLIYDDDQVRDYGAVVPMNFAMRARITSPRLVLASDRAGAPLSPQGVPFQVTAADFPANSLPGSMARMFPRPTAKFLRVYTAGRR